MQLQGASIRYRIAVGPIARRKTLRLHTPGAARERAEQPKPFTAERGGFLLNGGALPKMVSALQHVGPRPVRRALEPVEVAE